MAFEGHGEHILLVDDDPHLLTTLGDRLGHAGYKVTPATSGEQALEKLQEDEPDLIILDISMPGMGGIGFLKEISDENSKPRYPVLVLTARGAMESFFETLEVDGFIAKPCPAEQLMEKMQGALDRHPRVRRQAPDVAVVEPKMPDESEAKKRILIGEDSARYRTELREAFSEARYDIDFVNSGPQVIEQAVASKPDAIAIKESIPSMSGQMVASIMDGLPATCGIPVVLYDDHESELVSETVLAKMAMPRGVSAVLRTASGKAIRQTVDAALAGAYTGLKPGHL